VADDRAPSPEDRPRRPPGRLLRAKDRENEPKKDLTKGRVVDVRCFWCGKLLARINRKADLRGVDLRCPRCGRKASF
jgi:DNA-directed RNA polymerase subunit RPC12/RpoP